jgi:hypothetical protein
MKRLFRPRNLLLLAVLGVVAGVVLSRRAGAPAPTYPDPWATPATPASPDPSGLGSEAAEPTGEPAPTPG